MATVEQIRKAILKVAGNPSVGPIKAMATEMAEAIAELDAPVRGEKRTIETRVIGVTETR